MINYPFLFRDILYESLKFIQLILEVAFTGIKYYIPQYKTNRLQRYVKYVGVKIWNKIPDSIKKKHIQSIYQTTHIGPL